MLVYEIYEIYESLCKFTWVEVDFPLSGLSYLSGLDLLKNQESESNERPDSWRLS
jgi:hypothetical protein